MKKLLSFCSVSLLLISIASCRPEYVAPVNPYVCGNGVGATNNQGRFLKYSINGTADSFLTRGSSDSVYGITNKLLHTIEAGAFDSTVTRYTDILFDTAHIAVNSQQQLLRFVSSAINDSLTIVSPVYVNITQYNDTGHIISGNFTGLFVGKAPSSTTYNITASFRTRLRAE